MCFQILNIWGFTKVIYFRCAVTWRVTARGGWGSAHGPACQHTWGFCMSTTVAEIKSSRTASRWFRSAFTFKWTLETFWLSGISLILWVKYCACMHVCVLSCFGRVWLSVTPWTVAHQAPLSMGFSRQEHWSGLPFPSPGDLSDPGIEPEPPAWQAVSLLWVPTGKPKRRWTCNSSRSLCPLPLHGGKSPLSSGWEVLSGGSCVLSRLSFTGEL